MAIIIYTGNQLTSVMHDTTFATNAMAYDSTGNLIQDSTRTFNYDARGRMTSMTKNNRTTQYYYNGLGQRFRKNGIIYMYDLEGHLVGEYTNTGALIQETVWLNDLPIATIRPNGTGISVYFIHADELGTPRVVTGTAQKPVWRWDGDAFGRGLPNQDPLKTGKSFVYHLRYPGQYYDTESGLHYNYFRDYDPETGRYIQSDPIGLAGGFNTYAYVGGNPLRWVDPLGLDWEYSQSTGSLYYQPPANLGGGPPELVASGGYAGYGQGVNNPAMQHVSSVGPIPQGVYTIGSQQDNVTYDGKKRFPRSMRLYPDSTNEMYDRKGFLIHGDNRRGNQSASEGCIILNPNIRNQIGSSGDPILRVMP